MAHTGKTYIPYRPTVTRTPEIHASAPQGSDLGNTGRIILINGHIPISDTIIPSSNHIHSSPPSQDHRIHQPANPPPPRAPSTAKRIYLRLGATKNLLLTILSSALAIWSLDLAKAFPACSSSSSSSSAFSTGDPAAAVMASLILMGWALCYAVRFVRDVGRVMNHDGDGNSDDDDDDWAATAPFRTRRGAVRYLAMVAAMAGLHLMVMVPGWVWFARLREAKCDSDDGAEAGGGDTIGLDIIGSDDTSDGNNRRRRWDVDVVGALGMAVLAAGHLLKALLLASWHYTADVREREPEGQDARRGKWPTRPRGLELTDRSGEGARGVRTAQDHDRLGIPRIVHPSLYFI